jgi:hypothetical protein
MVPKVPPILGIELRWNVKYSLQKSKSSSSNISKKELKTVKSLRLNKVIRIVPADKDNCSVVLDEIEHGEKLICC